MRRRRLLVLLAALGLGGGGVWATTDPPLPAREQIPEPTERPSTDTATATATATATPVPEYSETKTYGGKSLTVAAPETRRTLKFEDETVTAEDGSVFLLLKLTTTNVGDQSMNVPSMFGVRTEEGETEIREQYVADSRERILSPERKLFGEVAVYWPEATNGGWLYAEIPADASTVTFVWFFTTRVRDEEDREITYRVPVPD
ncbi:hypothetical protein [Halolamina salifodinae]|uniref:DUF4352 domain-containing protein n=1 Tax=Halolamina salifodinae TaxID=1202767 RepID=A0A8T4GUA6_9EURY|nr:hypothetical protein [Halolamina salifodinae]MBP1985722.1 hypothetical protein [Halolamina salifodinae]